MASIPAEVPGTCLDLDALVSKKATAAHAQIWYACRYLEAVKNQTLMQSIVAGIQSAAQLYFADKQHDIAKQAQDRLDLIAAEQMRNSTNLRTQYEYIMACERQMADDACDQTAAAPDYDAIKARVTAPIRAQFSRLRQKLARCYPVNCAAMACGEERRIGIEEAKQITRAVEAAYRREEALHEARKAQAKAERLQALQAMRGHAQGASAALQGAAAAVQASAGINPYQGWIQAVNGIAGRVSGLLSADAAAGAFAGGMLRTGYQAPSVTDNGVYSYSSGASVAQAFPVSQGSVAATDLALMSAFGGGSDFGTPQQAGFQQWGETGLDGMGAGVNNPGSSSPWTSPGY